MIDEIFDRNYQQGRASLNRGIVDGFSRLSRTLGDSFTVLHRIEWNAPWQAQSKQSQCH
jgi:hypothetical protein